MAMNLPDRAGAGYCRWIFLQESVARVPAGDRVARKKKRSSIASSSTGRSSGTLDGSAAREVLERMLDESLRDLALTRSSGAASLHNHGRNGKAGHDFFPDGDPPGAQAQGRRFRSLDLRGRERSRSGDPGRGRGRPEGLQRARARAQRAFRERRQAAPATWQAIAFESRRLHPRNWRRSSLPLFGGGSSFVFARSGTIRVLAAAKS